MTIKKKRMLIIGHCYPPCASSGMQRVLKITKYIRESGWISDIITLKVKYGIRNDYGMIKEIPETTNVYRCNMIDPVGWLISLIIRLKNIKKKLPRESVKNNRLENEASSVSSGTATEIERPGIKQKILDFFQTPDKYIGWLWPGVLTGLRVLIFRKIDVIYSTSPPPTALLIGYYLKKLSRKKWVIDFRDPWTLQYPVLDNPGYKTRKSLTWEQKIVASADLILVNTEYSKLLFTEKYDQSVSGKIEVVMNGYDEEDFIDIVGGGYKKHESGFLFSHTGEFYENGQRVPDLFLKAVSELIRENLISANKIQIVLLGGGEYLKSVRYAKLLHDYNLNDVVQSYDHVPHAESLSCLIESDALLLFQNGTHFISQIPAKTFEYLRSGRPILAITNTGATAELLNDLRWCKVIVPDDLEGIKSAILDIMEMTKKSNRESPADLQSISQYSRKNQTIKLVNLLEKLIGSDMEKN